MAGTYAGKVKFAKIDAITNSKESTKLKIDHYNGEIDTASIKKFIDAQSDAHKTDLW